MSIPKNTRWVPKYTSSSRILMRSQWYWPCRGCRCTVTALHFSQIGKNWQNWQPRHSSARTCPGQHASGNLPSSRGMTSDMLAFFSQPTSFRADGFHLPHCATNQYYLEPSTSYLSPCSLLYVTFPLSRESTFVAMQYVYFIVTVIIPWPNSLW